jgi:hypothetical protein
MPPGIIDHHPAKIFKPPVTSFRARNRPCIIEKGPILKCTFCRCTDEKADIGQFRHFGKRGNPSNPLVVRHHYGSGFYKETNIWARQSAAPPLQS